MGRGSKNGGNEADRPKTEGKEENEIQAPGDQLQASHTEGRRRKTKKQAREGQQGSRGREANQTAAPGNEGKTTANFDC